MIEALLAFLRGYSAPPVNCGEFSWDHSWSFRFGQDGDVETRFCSKCGKTEWEWRGEWLDYEPGLPYGNS